MLCVCVWVLALRQNIRKVRHLHVVYLRYGCSVAASNALDMHLHHIQLINACNMQLMRASVLLATIHSGDIPLFHAKMHPKPKQRNTMENLIISYFIPIPTPATLSHFAIIIIVCARARAIFCCCVCPLFISVLVKWVAASKMYLHCSTRETKNAFSIVCSRRVH